MARRSSHLGARITLLLVRLLVATRASIVVLEFATCAKYASQEKSYVVNAKVLHRDSVKSNSCVNSQISFCGAQKDRELLIWRSC